MINQVETNNQIGYDMQDFDKVPQFINGQPVYHSGRMLNVYNPATGAIVRQVSVADKKIIDQAVQSAKLAFSNWSTTTPSQRAKILFRLKMLIEENRETLKKIITEEHGKTLNEAQASLQRGVDVLDFACDIPTHLKSTYTSQVGKEIDSYSLYQPLGVCVGITPFNFPAMIPLWMFSMAIACGNTFILKPSEKDPSCGLKLVELAKEAGLPDGVINLVNGDKETVDALLIHPDVDAVSFVGSSPVAEYVHHTAVANNKRVQAFGGAKNHCVVMPDADLDKVAESIVTAAYDCAGERCMAISVVVAVGNDVADQLVEKMKSSFAHIQIGPGTEPGVKMGPLVTREHWNKVKSYIELGKEEGASLIIDGSHDKPKGHENGFFMGACLFDHVKPSMRIYREEIFGPVLSVVRVPDFESAIKLVNTHEYGNGTAIFTNNGYIAKTFTEKVQVGMVGVNISVPVPVAYHSFGGWKRSIFSDIGMYGNEAVRFYTKLKTVTQRWLPKEII
jgi:malonate-semialdehyde dehydrogenase (acetylating)/methylmalonate-semialdehyde dehydrogenase